MPSKVFSIHSHKSVLKQTLVVYSRTVTVSDYAESNGTMIRNTGLERMWERP